MTSVTNDRDVILALDKHLEKIEWDLGKVFKNHQCASPMDARELRVYECGKIHGMESLLQNLKRTNKQWLSKNGQTKAEPVSPEGQDPIRDTGDSQAEAKEIKS